MSRDIRSLLLIIIVVGGGGLGGSGISRDIRAKVRSSGVLVAAAGKGCWDWCDAGWVLALLVDCALVGGVMLSSKSEEDTAASSSSSRPSVASSLLHFRSHARVESTVSVL